MSETATKAVPSEVRVRIVRDLVAALDAAGIRYCHWKSNNKLLASVTGATDLDILFELGRRDCAVAALAQAGVVRFSTAWQSRYPGIEDFIGIDPEIGRVVHVHAHFQLVVGESGLKSYHLPWEEYFLAGREWDESHGIWRSAAVSELLILFVREAMKFNDGQRARLLRPDRKLSSADIEYGWLKERVAPADLEKIAGEYLGGDGAGVMKALYDGGFSAEGLDHLQRLVTERLREYRRYSPQGVRRALFVRRVVAGLKRRAYAFGMKGLVSRRVVDGQGLIVALVGSDGAGKSTTVAAIVKELSRKVDVEHVYLGSGKGSNGLLRYAVGAMRINRLGIPGRVVWCMALALDKWARLRRIGRWRRAGKIMICDRYPQTDIEGYNDGPLLARFRDSGFLPLRAIAKWERRCYARTSVDAPDIACRLLADLAILSQRRPKMKIETIRRKQDGVRQFRFPETTKVVDIDAEQPAEVVVCNVMGEIGRALKERERPAHVS